MISASTWTTTGIVLGIAGVILLFRYGMPFRVRSDGYDTVVIKSSNPRESELDQKHTRLGYLGLILILLGAACQIFGVYVPV